MIYINIKVQVQLILRDIQGILHFKIIASYFLILYMLNDLLNSLFITLQRFFFALHPCYIKMSWIREALLL